MLYPGSRFRMADALLETYIRQLIEAHRTPHVVIAWQGGEPTLMGLEFFRRSVELAEKYRRPGMTIEYSIQTNGTLLNDEWGAFLATNRFLVGISIDGPRTMHDLYRYDKGGAPTFDRVMHGLDVLKRHSVEWNILTWAKSTCRCLTWPWPTGSARRRACVSIRPPAAWPWPWSTTATSVPATTSSSRATGWATSTRSTC